MVSYLKLKVVKVLNFLYNSTAFLSLRQKTVKSTETVHHRKIRFEVEAEGLILGSFYTFMGCFVPKGYFLSLLSKITCSSLKGFQYFMFVSDI